ncbi:hypothetical protein [Bradyrhizobium sp. NAS80.1]|uniref:hypothetical protein n=1 Tax=Bradyrhizobium sp. NAS80.1 TaxID=1680159 RepID=UPI001161060D|nr:hypothetical protein [Bradyrhizobium sp. NAS80.1]
MANLQSALPRKKTDGSVKSSILRPISAIYIAGLTMREIAKTLAREEESVERSSADTSDGTPPSRRGSVSSRPKSEQTLQNHPPHFD